MRRVMTQVETVKMSQLMTQYIRNVPGSDGSEPLCEYVEGWDDKRLALEIAQDLTATHSGGLRRKLHGDLRSRALGDESRIVALETALRNLLLAHQNLCLKHDNLCMAISVARGGAVDARHLKVNA